MFAYKKKKKKKGLNAATRQGFESPVNE